MDEIAVIKKQQLNWAKNRGIPIDRDQYVKSISDNFFTPLSDNTLRDFKAGSGSEIKSANERTKIFATHSSSALVCNVFEYWRGRDKALLANSLGLKQNIKSLVFEQKLSMGLKGNKPNLDIFLILENGQAVAIESKFTEWMSKKSKNKLFVDSYFTKGKKLWRGVGLPKCQVLAEEIKNSKVVFSYLNAPQLLKHALGLANMHSNRSSLLYLYYECKEKSEISQKHKEEILRFEEAITGELNFSSLTYQSLFKKLNNETKKTNADNAEYIYYLKKRYFNV